MSVSIEELELRLKELQLKSDNLEVQIKTIKKESIELQFLVLRLLHKNRKEEKAIASK